MPGVDNDTFLYMVSISIPVFYLDYGTAVYVYAALPEIRYLTIIIIFWSRQSNKQAQCQN